MRGADAVALALRAEGVPFVAGITSGSTMELADALLTNAPEIRRILTRHERVAADMADGYARVSGEPGVCLAVLGPGAAQLFGGIAQSFADGVPVLGIVGQTPRALQGTRGMSEMPLLDIFQHVTKWSASVTLPERASEVMRRAFAQLRNGPPGPAVIELPSDVANGEISASAPAYVPVRATTRYRPAADDVERAADLLVQAERPLVYAGAGVLRARGSAELQQLAELLSAPVMTTLSGKSALAETHPLSLGLGGFPRAALGTSMAHSFATRTDCLLAIGNSFAHQATMRQAFPDGVKLIHSNANPAEIDRIYATDVALVGDSRLALADLVAAVKDRLPRGSRGSRPDLVAEVAAAKETWLARWRPKLTSDEMPLNPLRVTWELNQILDRDNTILTHDAGAVRGHVCHFFESTVPGGFVGWGQQSEMGWSLGGAMGIKLACPEKTVAYVIGDGSFGMTGLDLETAVRNQIPTLGLLYNNRAMGIVMDIQRAQFADRFTMVELGGDYVAVARALGAHGERVERPAEIRPAIERALRAMQDGQPAIVEFMTKQLEPQPRPS